MWRSVLRTIGAIVAGIAVLAALSFGIEAAAGPLMMHLFPQTFPNAGAVAHSVPGQVVMFVYTFLSIVAGGYVAAWIAREHPVRDAVIMGVVEAALTAWVMSTKFHQPLLYSCIVGIVVCIPSSWFGGILRARTARPKAIPQAA
jgi:Fe2+ transport system protein B